MSRAASSALCAGISTDARDARRTHRGARPPSTRSPPVTSPPSAAAARSDRVIASKAAASISGPTSVPASRGSPMRMLRVDVAQALDERAIAGRVARTDGAASCSAGRRCPRPRTRSRARRDRGSPIGHTIAALLPPSSRIVRLNVARARRADGASHRGGAGGADKPHIGMRDQRLADGAIADERAARCPRDVGSNSSQHAAAGGRARPTPTAASSPTASTPPRCRTRARARHSTPTPRPEN